MFQYAKSSCMPNIPIMPDFPLCQMVRYSRCSVTPGGATIRKQKSGEGTLISYILFCISITHKKNPKSTFWRRSPSDLRNLGARGQPNPRWARSPQNSNSKFGRGSAQILNLNFAAPAGPARTTFPRPGRKMFAARGGENFVAGVRKSCGPGYLIAKGCAFSELCIIL